MQQTMLAILALIIATFLAHNQQRATLRAQEKMINTEMEVMASGVALQVMEYIGRKDFDNYTTNDQQVETTGELTPPSGFGQQQAERCDLVAPITIAAPYQNCDDLDDFHEMPLESVPFILKADTVYFDITAEVSYVNADGSETTSQTFDKKVTVYVQQSGDRVFLRAPVVLTRTFSYERI